MRRLFWLSLFIIIVSQPLIADEQEIDYLKSELRFLHRDGVALQSLTRNRPAPKFHLIDWWQSVVLAYYVEYRETDGRLWQYHWRYPTTPGQSPQVAVFTWNDDPKIQRWQPLPLDQYSKMMKAVDNYFRQHRLDGTVIDHDILKLFKPIFEALDPSHKQLFYERAWYSGPLGQLFRTTELANSDKIKPAPPMNSTIIAETTIPARDFLRWPSNPCPELNVRYTKVNDIATTVLGRKRQAEDNTPLTCDYLVNTDAAWYLSEIKPDAMHLLTLDKPETFRLICRQPR